MKGTIARKAKWRPLMGLALVAGWIISAGCVRQEEEGRPRAMVSLTGQTAFSVTPDSVRADPLKAERPNFVSFSLSLKSEETLSPGGRIRIEQGFLHGGEPLTGADARYVLPLLQIEDPEAPGFVSVSTEAAPVEPALIESPHGGASIQAVFPRGLPAGREVRFQFGDRSRGSPGLPAPTWPVKLHLLTFLDLSGSGGYALADCDHPEVEAFASGADRFKVIGPSITRAASIRLRIIPMRGEPGPERSALPVRDFQGKVMIYSESGKKEKLGATKIESGDRFCDVEVTLPETGLHRLTVVCEEDGLQGTSHPILYIEQSGQRSDSEGHIDPRMFFSGRNIYWGSLQNHTAVGGHAASFPEEAYRCSREEGGLDFCAVTDHSSNPSFRWGSLRTLPDEFDEPGRFAAFAGYEWTSSQYGHRHIVFKEGKETKACSEEPTDDPLEQYAPDLDALARIVGNDPNALIIAHHTRRILDPGMKRYGFGDPGLLARQILFEIFSWQGSDEGAVDDLPINGRKDRTLGAGSGFRDALDMGYRFGVTGDSDSHLGRPGVAVGIRRKNGMRYGFSGLTAVLAPFLDREGIFEALEERRCYATTGARILLMFQAGDGKMGEVVSCSDESIEIKAAAIGTAPIKKIQIIASQGMVVFDDSPESLEAFIRAEVPAPGKGEASCFYLRLIQADGHRAWSSPIWVIREAK
ncbi:MAG: DUF3604 domain-containing protein [Planctomycetota bacterium]|jgi:hypothetical protein